MNDTDTLRRDGAANARRLIVNTGREEGFFVRRFLPRLRPTEARLPGSTTRSSHSETRRVAIRGIGIIALSSLPLLLNSAPARPAPERARSVVRVPIPVPAVLAKVYRPRKSLLDGAGKVLEPDSRYHSHLWITDSRLLLITSRKPDRDREYQVYLTHWQGRAALLDLRTGRRTRLRGLTRLFSHLYATPDNFETSPDGRLLMWRNSETEDGFQEPAISRWDGSNYQAWQGDKERFSFWLDSHRWAVFALDHDEERKLIVYDADKPGKQRLLSRVSRQTRRMIGRCQAAQRPVVKAHGGAGSRNSVSIVSYRLVDYVTQTAPKPSDVHTVTLPAGTELERAVVDRRGRRVLYLLRFGDKTLPGEEHDRDRAYDVWASDASGANLHELGSIVSRIRADEDPDVLADSFEWLPGGKQIAFRYRGTLWTAKVR